MNCDQELCENWSGDGNVCPCAVFGIGKFSDTPGLRPEDLAPMTADDREWFDANRYPGPRKHRIGGER